ncbi:hypothetical protein ACFQH8_06455 [Halomicroarcula sp. GCM10025710]
MAAAVATVAMAALDSGIAVELAVPGGTVPLDSATPTGPDSSRCSP